MRRGPSEPDETDTRTGTRDKFETRRANADPTRLHAVAGSHRDAVIKGAGAPVQSQVRRQPESCSR